MHRRLAAVRVTNELIVTFECAFDRQSGDVLNEVGIVLVQMLQRHPKECERTHARTSITSSEMRTPAYSLATLRQCCCISSLSAGFELTFVGAVDAQLRSTDAGGVSLQYAHVGECERRCMHTYPKRSLCTGASDVPLLL
jgi:hypothetical protein